MNWLERCRYAPYAHQIVGIEKIVAHPYYALFDEMGAGKSIQTIVAALILYTTGVINHLLIVAPASVRSVWFDRDFGELAKHLWKETPARIQEFHQRSRTWYHGEPAPKRLEILVTNYEFIRSRKRLEQMLVFCGPRTMAVFDESSALKNYRTQQTKNCTVIRKRCGRVLLLNGTPIENNPGDMYSQANIMSPSILQCPSIVQFRARYAIMIPRVGYNQIIGWQNIPDLQKRMAPFVIRRLKKDCLDLPEKLPPVTIAAPLSEPTWKLYREMRDDAITFLNESVVVARQAIVKIMRLSQLTSGFIGGLQSLQGDLTEEELQLRPSWLPLDSEPQEKDEFQELGHEKQDVLIERWLQWLEDDPNLKLITFCKFRFELQRLMTEVRKLRPDVKAVEVMGGQTRSERDYAIAQLHPATAPPGPVFFGGTYGTGSKGLNLAASHTVVNCSYDYSLGKFLQSADRVHRPGQVHAVSYFDIEATGPEGQRTIDHAIIKARRAKEDVATWTQSAWLAALEEE